MSRDAERLGMKLGEQEAVRRAVASWPKANHRPEGMARLSFVKNHGGLSAQAGNRPETDLLIFTRELVRWPAIHRLELQAARYLLSDAAGGSEDVVLGSERGTAGTGPRGGI